jgi:hypothetical protein
MKEGEQNERTRAEGSKQTRNAHHRARIVSSNMLSMMMIRREGKGKAEGGNIVVVYVVYDQEGGKKWNWIRLDSAGRDAGMAMRMRTSMMATRALRGPLRVASYRI